MRALVLHGPLDARIDDVPAPDPRADQAVVRIHRVGLCGTDLAFFRGTMPYLQTGGARYPLRIGHEWVGTVTAAPGDPDWVGARVTGDTMLGCGTCPRCRGGQQHVCAERFEIGVLGGWHGAAAEELLVPTTCLHRIPDGVDDPAAALVEPAANGARAVRDGGVVAGQRAAVIGPGTLGSMATAFAARLGAEVEVIGRSDRGLDRAIGFGARKAWRRDDLTRPGGIPGDFDVVIEASGGAGMPQLALELVRPGGTVVCVGINGDPTPIDTRDLVTRDIRLIGNLSGSPAMAETIAAFADGSIDPTPLVDTTAPLEDGRALLAAADAGKIHLTL